MALRPPPRAAPYTDYEELLEELSSQFNVFGNDGERKYPPDAAKTEWTAAELQMWFASGGAIEPSDNPKMRAAAAALSNSQDLRSPAEIEAEQRVKDAQAAARNAPYFSKLNATDVSKAELYREAALAFGHAPRDVGDLYPADDPWLKSLQKSKHIMPFEKHLLLWNEGDGALKNALHAPEGFTHGSSAALRGMDMRYFWDASTLKVVGAVRYSLAAVIGWEHSDEASWSVGIVHGGCIEMVLDELTAEVCTRLASSLPLALILCLSRIL